MSIYFFSKIHKFLLQFDHMNLLSFLKIKFSIRLANSVYSQSKELFYPQSKKRLTQRMITKIRFWSRDFETELCQMISYDKTLITKKYMKSQSNKSLLKRSPYALKHEFLDQSDNLKLDFIGCWQRIWN